MKTHCSCCYPLCPVPVLERQEKGDDISPVGHSPHNRYEDRDDANLAYVALPDIQPDASYEYRSRRQLETKLRNSTSGNFTTTESGTFYLDTVYSYDDTTGTFSGSSTSGGGLTYIYTEVDDNDDVIERITRVWEASTASGHEDQWLETHTHLLNGTTTVTTGYDNFSSVGDTGWPIEANRTSFLSTYSHTAETKSEVYPDGTYYASDTRSEEWTEADLKGLLEDYIDKKAWTAGGTEAVYEVEYELDYANTPATETIAVDELSLSTLRYRCTIPEDFDPPPAPDPQKWHGTYHKIEYTETFTPFDHDTENPTASPIVTTDKSIEWTGPGTLGDAETWASPWIETGYPTTKGTITVDLTRSQCYHGAPWVYH